jgi:vacuolar-type H+-ATPase subunit E/Vma4
MLEATQKALEAQKNIVETAQTKVEELLSKINNGEELSDREQKTFQINLSVIQKLASIAGN